MADELFNEESTASLVNQFSCKRVQCDGSGSFDFVVINVDSLGVEQANPVVSHSKVYRGVWKGQKVAVKIVGSLNQREVEVLNGINHKNIVHFFGAIYDPPANFGLVTQLCDKGSLFDYIHDERNPLQFAMVLQLAKGIVNGVLYLHRDAPDSPIKHNNLNSHEVVLTEEKGVLVPKISGFGYARQHSETQMTTSRGKVNLNTLMSPERINGERSSPESDMYSVGIILYELVSRKVPFEGLQLFDALIKITDDEEHPEIPSSCPEEMAGIITWCWQQKPEDRLTAGEVNALLECMTKKLCTKKPDVPKPWNRDWQIDEVAITETSEPFDMTGRIGIVRKAKYQRCPVMLKGVKYHLMDGFDRYVEVVVALEHENIVKVLGATCSHIVMQQMPQSLECRLREGPITDNSTFLKIAIDVASGLQYLHKLTNAVFHGSIHPQNVFLDSDNNAKISDCGYVILNRAIGLAPRDGMEAYHAPEANKITRYGPGVDIYSFGVLLAVMYTLETDCCAKLKSSWPDLHALVSKCTKKRQEGMYFRGKLSMRYLIKELKKMYKD